MRCRSVEALLASGAVVAVAVVGCTGTRPSGAAPAVGSPPASNGLITVQADNIACTLSSAAVPAGPLTFNVTNTGADVAEFSLYSDRDERLGAVENVGPGLTRQLVVEVPDSGIYNAVCKPGNRGGARVAVTVTGSATRSTETNAKVGEAIGLYKDYVTGQIESLVPKAQKFVDAVKAGNVDEAKASYPVARICWERIEPVAESFDDIDAKVDGRESDERAPGVAFTGFHRLEKDLWVDGLQVDSPAIAAQLMTDIKELQTHAVGVDFTPPQLVDGTKELLEEVALVKLAGEEERYSHTDLWDVAANVEGSQAVIAALREVINEKDPTLGRALDEQVDGANNVLAGVRIGDGFRTRQELSPYEIQKLIVAVDSLGASLGRISISHG
jgi:iron uptake system component EfeO